MNFIIAFGVTLALIALRLFLLPAEFTWPAVGIILTLWGWSWLVTKDSMKNHAKHINLVFSVIIGAAVISTVGYNIYQGYIKPNTPHTRTALAHGKNAADLEGWLKLNPPNLQSRGELAGQLQWLQNQLGDHQAKKLEAIRNNLGANTISLENAWRQTEILVAEEIQYRRKIKENTARLSSADGSLGGELIWLGIIFLGIGVGILLINAYVSKIKIPAGKLIASLGALALLGGITITQLTPLKNYFQNGVTQTGGLGPGVAAKTTGTFQVPPGQIINTGIFMNAGQSAHFSQPCARLFYLKGTQYDVPVRSKKWSDKWNSPGQIGLRGGPVATTVTVTLN
jgi:hypothetical protein